MFPLQGCLLQARCGNSGKALRISRKDTGFKGQIRATSFPGAMKQDLAFIRISRRAWQSTDCGAPPPEFLVHYVWVRAQGLRIWPGAAGAPGLGPKPSKLLLEGKFWLIFSSETTKTQVHQHNPECLLPLQRASRTLWMPNSTQNISSLSHSLIR